MHDGELLGCFCVSGTTLFLLQQEVRCTALLELHAMPTLSH